MEKEESFALEILREQRKSNKRLFIALVLVIILWFITGCYLAYVLNDIGTDTTTTTTTTETIDIDDVDTINESEIHN